MKKTFLILCACVMALGSFAQTNLALNKTATASSGDAAQAVDGNTGTRWESSATDTEWWYVDLGSSQTFNTLQIVWEGAYTKSFEIYTATTATTEGETTTPDWGTTPVYTVTNHTPTIGGDGQLYKFDAAVTAQYVKFQVKERGTQWGNSFYEFRIFNIEATTLASVSASAAYTNVYKGMNVALTSEAKGANGNTYLDATISWEITPAEGASISGNTFSATTAGTYSIVAVAKDGETTVRSEAVTINVRDNIIQGATATGTGFATPANAVDGNWSTKAGGDGDATSGSLLITLPNVYDLSTIAMLWQNNAYASVFTLSASETEDGTYTTVCTNETSFTTTSMGAQDLKVATISPTIAAKYIKLEYSALSADAWGAQLYELAAEGSLHNYGGTLETVTLTANPAIVFAGNAVTFTPTYTDNYGQSFTPTTVVWYVNDVEQANAPDVSTFTAGTYTIKVKADAVTSDAVTVKVLANDATNLAREATATSNIEGSNPAGAIDGTDGQNNDNYQWHVDDAAVAGAYILLTFPYSINVDYITTSWEGACPKAYTIEVSADGTTYNQVYTYAGTGEVGSAGKQNHYGETINNIKYLRLTTTEKGTHTYGAKLHEIYVYGEKVVHADAAVTTVTLAADATSMVAGRSINLTATYTDQYGDPIEPKSVTWNVTTGGQVENGVFTAETAGEYTVSVTADEKTSNTVTITVTAPFALTTTADDPTLPSNYVYNVYSNTYANSKTITGVITNWDTFNSTAAEVTIDGNSVLHITNAGGISFNTLSVGDLSEATRKYTKIHMDVLPVENVNVSNLKLGAQGGTETSIVINKTLTAQTWNAIDLNISDAADVTKLKGTVVTDAENNVTEDRGVDFITIKMGDNNDADLYIDNIYFYSEPAVTPELTANDVDANGLRTFKGTWVSATFNNNNSGKALDLTAVEGVPAAITTENPNAILIVTAEQAAAINNTSNVVVKATVDENTTYTAANIALTDGNDPYTVLTIAATAATYTRNFNAGYATIVLPFAAAVPEGVEAYTLAAYSEGSVTFSPVDALAAGTPYIVNVETAGAVTFTKNAGDVNYTLNNTTAGDATFNGNFAKQTLSNGYVLKATSTDLTFFKADGANVGAFRAYLTGVSAPAGGSVKVFLGDDLATGINQVENGQKANGAWYDLSGRRVNNAQRGIYIVNGKKVVLK